MSKRFDELFEEIAAILRSDWAGFPMAGDRLDLKYYNQAVGQAWRDGKLDELLFLRYMSQMLACTGDRHLRLFMRPSDTYAPWSPGFFARRYENALYVTAAGEETRLAPGDRIDRINGGTPEEHRRRIQKDFFYSAEPEREDWRGLLKMAEHIDVTRADGSSERLALGKYPVQDGPAPAPRVLTAAGGTVIDLRNLPDLDEDALYALMPLVCREDTPLSALTDTALFVNYTRRNCLVKAAALRGLDGAEPFIAELAEKAGKGLLAEDAGDDTVIPGEAKGRVAVLTDTWTRGGAETLALAAKRAGAYLIGRPTLGTLDLCGDVSLRLDERYTLTWPTAVTKAALDGNGVFGRGVTPDRYIPFTPAECREDILLRTAMDCISE